MANYVTGIGFAVFLRQRDIHIRQIKACYLQLIVQATKYVPGNVWGAIVQAQLLGISRVPAVFMAGLDTTLFYMMTVSTTGMVLLLATRSTTAAIFVGALCWLVAAVVASSALTHRVTRIVAAMVGKDPGPAPSRATGRVIGELTAGAVVQSLLQSGSFVCMLSALPSVGTEHIIVGTASLCLAWVVGTLAVFTPSGLGVREVAFVAVAAHFGLSANLSTLAAIAVTARVIQTLPDILAAIIVVVTQSIQSLSDVRPSIR